MLVLGSPGRKIWDIGGLENSGDCVTVGPFCETPGGDCPDYVDHFEDESLPSVESDLEVHFPTL